MPVSSSHSGPVMLMPSIAIRPASSSVLMVVPAYCLAASTAFVAAFSWAAAGIRPTIRSAVPAIAAVADHLAIVVTSPFLLDGS